MPFKLAEAYVELSERGLGSVSGQISGLVSQFQGLSKGILSAEAGLTSLSTVGIGAIVALGAKSIQVGAQLEDAMAEVSTLVDTTVVSMEKMRSELVDMSTDVRKSSIELAEGLYQVVSAGIDAENATSVLAVSAKAATASMTDTFTAVDLITTVLNSYNMETSEAGKVSDQLFTAVKLGKTRFGELAGSLGRVLPIASELNVSLDEVLGVIVQLTKGGLSTSEAVTALRSAMMEFLKPSEKAVEILGDQANLMSRNAVESKGLLAALNDLRTSAEGSGSQLEDLIGRQEALLAITRTTGRAMDDTAESIKEVGEQAGTTEEAFAKKTKTLTEQSKLVGLELEKSWTNFSDILKGPATGAVKLVTHFIRGLNFTLSGGIESVNAYRKAMQKLWDSMTGREQLGRQLGAPLPPLSIPLPPLPSERPARVGGLGVLSKAEKEDLEKRSAVLNIHNDQVLKDYRDRIKEEKKAQEDATKEELKDLKERSAVLNIYNQKILDDHRERLEDQKKANKENLEDAKDKVEDEADFLDRMIKGSAKAQEEFDQQALKSAEEVLKKEREREEERIKLTTERLANSEKALKELGSMESDFYITAEEAASDFYDLLEDEQETFLDQFKGVVGDLRNEWRGLSKLLPEEWQKASSNILMISDVTTSAIQGDWAGMIEAIGEDWKRFADESGRYISQQLAGGREILDLNQQFNELYHDLSKSQQDFIQDQTEGVELTSRVYRDLISQMEKMIETEQEIQRFGDSEVRTRKQIQKQRDLERRATGVVLDREQELDRLRSQRLVDFGDKLKRLRTEASEAERQAFLGMADEREDRQITGGMTISQITGPTRDILVNLLSPLKQLNTTFPAMLDELRMQTLLLSGGAIQRIPRNDPNMDLLGGGIVVEGDIVIQVSENSDLTAESINEQLQQEVLISRKRVGAA